MGPLIRRAGAVGAALAATALIATLLAGCGGGGGDGVAVAADAADTADTSTTATTTTDPEDAEAAMLAFARCMREQGIDMDDPQPDEDGTLRFAMPRPDDGDREAMRTAMEACGDLMAAARPQLSDEDRAEREEQQLAFARCMREEGIDMPDPSSNGGPGQGGTRLDMDDPATQEAMQTCQEEVGGEFFGGPGGGGAPPSGGTRPDGAPSQGGDGGGGAN